MLLLIEDNPTIANNIKQYLELHEYRVELCEDGKKWLALTQEKHYDLIILDVMLPEMDWFEVLEHIRKTKQVPVIMTTAKWQLEDKTLGFESGADDYLVKPFELQELLMRIQALLKRSQTNDIITFKDLEINFEHNEVLQNGKEIKLTNKEWLILWCLYDSHWQALSRADIVEFVRWWDSIRENDSKLDVYISTLRKKLDKELIETVKWFGYKIAKK